MKRDQRFSGGKRRNSECSAKRTSAKSHKISAGVSHIRESDKTQERDAGTPP